MNNSQAETGLSGERILASGASFCVTIIGTSPAESEALENALHRISGTLNPAIRRHPAVAGLPFPERQVHAIVLTPAALGRTTPQDANTVRQVTRPGTCRVYLLVCPGTPDQTGDSLLDDFIQRTRGHSPEAIAEQVIEFFREAGLLNRRSTLLAFRDFVCLGAFKILSLLWPSSYAVGALLVLNALAGIAGLRPFSSLFSNPYGVSIGTFLGLFLIAHCLFVVSRNTLFALRIVNRLDFAFLLHAGTLLLAASATAWSITLIDRSRERILICAVAVLAAYRFYLYVRRIRAECTSLSQIHLDMANPDRRGHVITTIGRQPFTPNAFPLFPFPPAPLFVSYMHGSAWSSQIAESIHASASARRMKVFLDRSTIPSGVLWRQFLLRSVSECGCFIAVLDGDAAATEWVLAESAYAALLRKSLGKPRIILVIRNSERFLRDRQNPFHVVYTDLFEMPPELCFGAGVISADHQHLSGDLILNAIRRTRPMSLLG